jgi:hypothetical protein
VKIKDGALQGTDPNGLMGYVAVPFWKWFADIPYA